MKFNHFSLISFISLLSSASVFAFEPESQLRCLYSSPTGDENVDVNIAECSYLHTFEFLTLTDELKFYPVLSVGRVITDNDYGTLLGGGLGVDYKLHDKWHTFFEGGGYWLSDYQYGEVGVAVKNYGGNKQFFAKLGLNYTFYNNWMIGYSYLHVSNGRRYEENPSYDGHSITFGYRFR